MEQLQERQNQRLILANDAAVFEWRLGMLPLVPCQPIIGAICLSIGALMWYIYPSAAPA